MDWCWIDAGLTLDWDWMGLDRHRIGNQQSDQQWIGTGLPLLGYELASDWQWIGTGSASGWYWTDDGSALDWKQIGRIDIALGTDWRWIDTWLSLERPWIVSRLASDWHWVYIRLEWIGVDRRIIGTGLAMDWLDWHLIGRGSDWGLMGTGLAWIGFGLTSDWHWIENRLALQWSDRYRIGTGLAGSAGLATNCRLMRLEWEDTWMATDWWWIGGLVIDWEIGDGRWLADELLDWSRIDIGLAVRW